MNALAGIFFTSLLSVFGKLATQAFFEAVIIRVFLFCGDKLAAMTTNELDNELMTEARKRLVE